MKQTNTKTIFLCDFDGTISRQDIGDLILDNLAPEREPITIEPGSTKSGSRYFYTARYSTAKFSETDLLALVNEVDIDPHFAELCQLAKDRGDEVVIVSDGFDQYIQLFMARFGLSDIPVYCNEMKIGSEIDLAFPHHNVACGFCANCKAGVAASFLQQGYHTVYVGDGTSDKFPVQLVDRVYAKGTLARICREDGVNFSPFETFDDVIKDYNGGWAEPPKGRSYHSKCRSVETANAFPYVDHEKARRVLL